MKYRIFTIFVVLVILSGVKAHFPRCSTLLLLKQGWVQGEEFESTQGKPFCAYRGIRYGEPPLGELRFKPPRPAGPWSGILNATTDGAFCPQRNGLLNTNEDCLTLNVYSPSLFRNYGFRQRLPVMVFIHGGGFTAGGAAFTYYSPLRFMNEDVIIVNIQYRLGVLGFLSTATADASGNWGLLDQRLALQWVQDNIERFGGDRKRVVIFGESAGSGSVIYQLISRGSKGLFHGAIGESGTVLSPWTLQPNPRDYALQLATALQCNTSNGFAAMVACLRTVPVQNFFAVIAAKNWDNTLTGVFTPVLENPAYARFIDENALELLRNGDISTVPLIIGTNRDETAFLFAYGSPIAAYFNKIDATYFNVYQPALILQATKQNVSLVEKSYKVKAEYWDEIDLNNRTAVLQTAVKWTSDISFISGTSTTARLLARRRIPVYQYVLAHAGNVSTFNVTGQKDIIHGDDIAYLFYTGDLTTGDEKFSRNLVKMWKNFAGRLNPTPLGQWTGTRWDTVGTGEKLRYFKFGEERNSMEFQTDDMVEKEKFWQKLAPYDFQPNV